MTTELRQSFVALQERCAELEANLKSATLRWQLAERELQDNRIRMESVVRAEKRTSQAEAALKDRTQWSEGTFDNKGLHPWDLEPHYTNAVSELTRRKAYAKSDCAQMIAEGWQAAERAEAELVSIKQSRDYWMESCQKAQEHRDGANAQLAIAEADLAECRQDVARWNFYAKNPYRATDAIFAVLDVNRPAYWQQVNAAIDDELGRKDGQV